MKVFIDLDGVLADFVQNVIPVANELWPNLLPADYHPPDWDFSDKFSSQDWDTVWGEIKKIPDFWFRAKPIESNVSALRTWLKSTEHQVFYITSRIETGSAYLSAHMQTAQWLMHHDLYPSWARLIVVTSAEKKTEVIASNGIDYGIDDYAPTVNALNMISWHHCYLLDQPWNQSSNQSRVSSVQEFLDIVDLAAANHPDGFR